MRDNSFSIFCLLATVQQHGYHKHKLTINLWIRDAQPPAAGEGECVLEEQCKQT